MTKPQVTDWFPASVKPVRVGVYEKKIGRKVFFQHWNGEFFGCIELTPQLAKQSRNFRSAYQRGKWRGLTAKAD